MDKAAFKKNVGAVSQGVETPNHHYAKPVQKIENIDSAVLRTKDIGALKAIEELIAFLIFRGNWISHTFCKTGMKRFRCPRTNSGGIFFLSKPARATFGLEDQKTAWDKKCGGWWRPTSPAPHLVPVKEDGGEVMGSLYKRGEVWWIKYSDRKGKVIRESTKSTKKMVATRMLERREGEIAEGKMPSIYVRIHGVRLAAGHCPQARPAKFF